MVPRPRSRDETGKNVWKTMRVGESLATTSVWPCRRKGKGVGVGSVAAIGGAEVYKDPREKIKVSAGIANEAKGLRGQIGLRGSAA